MCRVFPSRTAAGLLKRHGKVYTRPVPNLTRETLRAVIRQKVPQGTTIYSDQLSSYDGLITQGYRHYRIHHGVGFALRTSGAMPRPS